MIKIILLLGGSLEGVLDFHALFAPLKLGKEITFFKCMVGTFSVLTSLQYLLSPLYSVCVLCVYTDRCITSFLHLRMHVPVNIYSPQLLICSTKNKFIYTA